MRRQTEYFDITRIIDAATIRIDNVANVIAEVYYCDSQELNHIMEKIKSMKNVQNVVFSEIVAISNCRSIGGIMKED